MAWETYAQIAVVLGTGLTIVLVLRNSLKDLRGELKADIQEVRTELKADIQKVRSEMQEVRTELKADIHTLQQQMTSQGERVARIEGMLASQIPGLFAREAPVSVKQAAQSQRLTEG